MCSSEELFSLRIVIAEFYMEKPSPGLDACYSEFRGKEIKKVPVIRIFGANAQGQKTCMHVHGVFPYFYIPYDQKDFESVNQAIYQIAINLDKAINISLSQGSSNAQHVFKVQLVKGIPFYGYHRSEHQFLKIYMFNPRFVRRAANLLQNGAILNKNFHPHESHVPYILQFMIDFNLYGMSFLHVPLEIVKFRRSEHSAVIPFKHIKETQILNVNLVKKTSCSSLEVDIGSNFILNRFQLIAKINTTHSNPGIESIWHDEHLRREKMRESFENEEEKWNAIPSLEIPSTQERPDVQITESEIFFRTSLLSKLSATEISSLDSTQMSDQTLNTSRLSNITLNGSNSNVNKQRKRTFNLSKILQNFVYPEECTQNNNLINASFIPNHLSSNSLFEQSLLGRSNEEKVQEAQNIKEDESIFLEDTIVDEELVLSLTQNQSHVPLNETLREEDMELLDILQELEENNEEKIDLDSSLAPLSQNYENLVLSPQELDKKTTAAARQQPKLNADDDDDDDESDENPHDFSIALENLHDLILKFTQSQNEINVSDGTSKISLPQSDGADDLLKTPTKVAKTIARKSSPRTPSTPKNRRLTVGSPGRSPKTPKTGHKYAQLPLVIVNRSTAKNATGITPLNEDTTKPNSLSLLSFRKNLALSDLRRKSISVDNNIQDYIDVPTTSKRHKRSTKQPETLDKTHITCALTPRRTNKKSLKVYKIKNDTKNHNGNKETSANTQNNRLKTDECDKTKKNEFVCQNKESDNLSHTTTLNNSETDEEIVESDNEPERGVTNLKKLRRSHLPPLNATLRSRTRTSGALTSNSTIKCCEIIKKTEGKDKEKHFKYRKCLVRLKRLEKHNVQTGKGNPQNEDKAIKKSNMAKNLENLNKLLVHSTSSNTSKERMAKEKDAQENLSLIDYTNSPASVANEKSSENVEAFTESNSMNELIDSFNCELSDEIVDSTPPQSNNQTFQPAYSCEKLISLQSPALFASQNSSPVVFDNAMQQNCKASSSQPLTLSSDNLSSCSPKTNVIITPLDLPPSREEVLKGCRKLQIPEFEFQQPFYSNPNDITKHKELGFTILQIPGNKLNDVEEFHSILGDDIKGLTSWRRKQLMRLGGVEMLNNFRNTQSVREYFSSRKSVIITPQFEVPTRQEVKLWLKARELIKTTEGILPEEMNSKNLDDDSPIKVKRQKVTMMLNAEYSGDDKSDDDSLNCSLNTLSLTPLTPAAATHSKLTAKAEQKNFTPVSRNSGKICLKPDTSLRKRNNCRVLRRVSLNKQFKQALEKEAKNVDSQESATSPCATKSSQRSETSVSNETVLEELERSSFMRQLKEADATGVNSTLNSSFGFKVALENLQQAKSDIECNYLTIITLEVFAATREDFYPNPELDEIRCLFYAIENSIPNDYNESDEKLPRKACGYIMVHDHRDVVSKEGRIHGIDSDIDVTIVQTEVEALEALLSLCSRWDPDIYAGYEIEMSSWGFVIERAKFLCLNIAPLLSRVPTQKARDFVDEDRESFTDLDIEMKLCGRILLDVWRLLRSEIALTSYSFENVMYHIMHKRCPWHSYRSLTEWFASPCSRWIVMEYYLERVRGTLALLDQLDLIGRTSEMAKLIGIQFYEVLSRGSQFRVESMMLRIAKPKNLVPLSPSVQQRAHMRAPEYLALIMEPQSRFYADPLIVLDFQSLYPSMIIGYNYCFSTCLGRVEHLGQSTPFEFGASQLRVSPALLRKLIDNDLVTISPCGVVFVKSSVREGILPRMLTEILDTRQMVKQSMKLHKSNSALQRILHSRQLGLKLMANVTYGYTAANFSGRMPAVEVGDSVVSKGRETLERAIKMVEANDKWNVRVVYGDTDSMFVLVPGRSREEAFRIGEEIAEAVTKQNPQPVKLKLEKVYQPCILQTKKRYVGYMYETPDQKEPVYEAKGIETVRRDGCPLVAKMLEKVLRILFETADVSQVKHYVCRQFTKLLSGRANLQDLIFAKEFRGLNGYRPTACVPALELTRKWIQTDPRRIPRRGERVPFIITNGPPGVPLIRLVRHPHDVLADEGLKINAVYYITKAIIPPLNRCLLLIGADVNEWFASLPRKILLTPALSIANEIVSCPNATKSKKSTISQFFSTTNCITDCGRHTKEGICSNCCQNSTRSVVILHTKISKLERSYLTTQNICQACCGRVGDLKCGSLDCPVLYVLEVKRRDLQQITHFRNLMEEKF